MAFSAPFRTMSVSEVRRTLNALLGERNMPIIITRHGHDRGVLIDIETYNSLLDELEDARDDRDVELARAIAEARAAESRAELVALEDALSDHGV